MLIILKVLRGNEFIEVFIIVYVFNFSWYLLHMKK